MKTLLKSVLTGGLCLLFSALAVANPLTKLSEQDQTTLWKQIHAVIYQFHEKDGIFTANNAKQQLHARITPSMVQVKPRQADWQLSLTLSAYGYGDQLKTVQAGRTVITERGLESQHPGITEWYVNNSQGLRQNFTLNQPPGQQRSKPLRVALRVNGDLRPQLSANKQTIHLTNQGGDAVLHYSGLYVYDADEKAQPAHFTLADGQIVIEVDDSQARYPLTIDPVLYTQQAELTAGNDAAARDLFGFAVAVDGDTALVGAPEDDENGLDSGSAYVFVFNGTNWVRQGNKLIRRARR